MHLKLKILPGKDYHRDFQIRINGVEEYADTYYFWIDEFKKLEDPYEGIISSVSDYLRIWVLQLTLLPEGQRVFMPLDFSDEYVGGFGIHSRKDTFVISYGYIYDVLNLVVRVHDQTVYTNLNDKDIDSVLTFEVEKRQFLESLRLENSMK